MLATAEDKERIRNGPKAIIKNQVLQIQDWYPRFNPNKQRTSHAVAWVMLPELPMELWTEKSILSISKSFGTPIVVDEKTLRLEYGYFASVLVDIDFSKHISERILLKANGKEFWQYMDIHKRPQFCAKCSIIGHCEEDCRKKSSNKTKTNQLQVVAAEIPIMRNDSPPGMEWQVAENKNTGKQDPVIQVIDDRDVAGSSHAAVVEKHAPVGTTNLDKQRKDNTMDVMEKNGSVGALMNDENKFDATSAEDTKLEEELNNSFTEYREAQLKLTRCKNAIASKADLAARKTSAHADHAAIPTEVKQTSVNNLEIQPLSAQNLDDGWTQVKGKHSSSKDKTNEKGTPFTFKSFGDVSTSIADAVFGSEFVVQRNQFETLSAELGFRDDEGEVHQSLVENLDEKDEDLDAASMAAEVKNSKEWGTVSDHNKSKNNDVLMFDNATNLVENSTETADADKKKAFLDRLEALRKQQKGIILNEEELADVGTIKNDEVRCNFIINPAYRKEYFQEKKELLERVSTKKKP